MKTAPKNDIKFQEVSKIIIFLEPQSQVLKASRKKKSRIPAWSPTLLPKSFQQSPAMGYFFMKKNLKFRYVLTSGSIQWVSSTPFGIHFLEQGFFSIHYFKSNHVVQKDFNNISASFQNFFVVVFTSKRMQLLHSSLLLY